MSEHNIRDSVNKAIEKTDSKNSKSNLNEVYKELENDRRQDPRKFQTDLKEANAELIKHGFPTLTIEPTTFKLQNLPKIADKNDSPVTVNGQVADGGAAAAPVFEENNLNSKTEAPVPLKIDQFSEKFMTLFDKLNTTNDLVLSTEELATALQSHDLTTQEMQVVTAMYANRDQLGDLNYEDANGGITRNDLIRFGEVEQEVKSKTAGVEDKKVVNLVRSTMDRVAAQEKFSTQLFGKGDDPLNSIKPEAVKQQSIGDCYFDAPLASLAATNPQQIKDMIRDNGDGTYTVTFPGAKDEPITVTGPTSGELTLYNSGTEYGTWANVLEKAYGKYCQESLLRRSPFNIGGGNTPSEGADGASATNSADRLLTGRNTTDSDMLIFTSQLETAQKLTEAFSSTPPKVVSARVDNMILRDKTEDGFTDAHVYSIIGFTPDGKGSGTIIVRNPWGGANNTTSGTMSIPLEKFMKNFSNISYT